MDFCGVSLFLSLSHTFPFFFSSSVFFFFCTVLSFVTIVQTTYDTLVACCVLLLLSLSHPPSSFFLSCGCLPLMDIPRTIPKAERRTRKVTPPHKSRWSYGAWRCHCVEGLAAVTLLQRHPPSYACYYVCCYNTARSPPITPGSVRSPVISRFLPAGPKCSC